MHQGKPKRSLVAGVGVGIGRGWVSGAVLHIRGPAGCPCRAGCPFHPLSPLCPSRSRYRTVRTTRRLTLAPSTSTATAYEGVDVPPPPSPGGGGGAIAAVAAVRRGQGGDGLSLCLFQSRFPADPSTLYDVTRMHPHLSVRGAGWSRQYRGRPGWQDKNRPDQVGAVRPNCQCAEVSH